MLIIRDANSRKHLFEGEDDTICTSNIGEKMVVRGTTYRVTDVIHVTEIILKTIKTDTVIIEVV
jgi:hypothetical protein